jgi:AraC family transcriptional regulator
MLMDSAPTATISSAFDSPAPLQPRRWFSQYRPTATAYGQSKHGETGAHPLVEISPSETVTRHRITRHGLTAELVHTPPNYRTEHRFNSSVHLLAVFEEAQREDGETFVEGLPRSTQRNVSHKLTFVPAGHTYYEWQIPRTPTRVMFIYLDPTELALPLSRAPTPRLFFEDNTLWESALKLKRAVEFQDADSELYFDALGLVLVHELARLRGRNSQPVPHVKGGLAPYHQRIVNAYIEEHLSEPISLATLAQLARLSPYHFCRAFKQSFGMPPHRYHATRRIERAKCMLAKLSLSVTQIGLELGFCETSSFCSAFRKATGLSPTGYRRTLC